MLDRLENALGTARRERRAAVIPYVTIGFPTLDDTLAIVPAIERAGADVIELGVPYSDPLADGPTIQAASHRALQGGMNMRGCLEAARALRQAGVGVPLVFMGYYNPILRYGVEAYAADCADAGVDALLVPDLPPDEAGELRDALQRRGLGLASMLAPTSTDERIALGCAASTGFVYCVSVAGVTGSRSDLPDDLPEFIARARRHTSLPIAVGFGVSERRHVERVGEVADAAAVGSALIEAIGSAPPGEAASRAEAFIRSLARSSSRG